MKIRTAVFDFPWGDPVTRTDVVSIPGPPGTPHWREGLEAVKEIEQLRAPGERVGGAE